jgi:hypothetical protein
MTVGDAVVAGNSTVVGLVLGLLDETSEHVDSLLRVGFLNPSAMFISRPAFVYSFFQSASHKAVYTGSYYHGEMLAHDVANANRLHGG